MNETALNRYINRPFNFHGKLTKQPILIADSKGNYLKPHEYLIRQFGYSIDFQLIFSVFKVPGFLIIIFG